MTATVPPDGGGWTAKQFRLRLWLERKGSGLAEAYSAAIELVARGRFTGAGSLLAHALRDLINRLPDAVSGRGVDWMDAAKALDALRKIWTDENLPLQPPAPPESQSIPPEPERRVPNRVFEAMQRTLHEREAARGNRTANAQRLFRDLLGPGVEPNPAVVAQWVRLGRWTAANAHFDSATARDVDWDEACEQLALFEATLEGVVNRFFEVTDALDEILEDANS